jgi:ATP-dependent Clp protease ATP-binding subunit ClpC
MSPRALALSPFLPSSALSLPPLRTGGLDVANLLKPALARGELQCIAATTRDEFAKYFEKDAALERRFQPVAVPEPTEAQALAVLEGLAERYERHHRCLYADGALAAAVALSARYVADRFLPDKAIDLIDEAGSRARIEAHAARRAALGGPGGNAAAGAAYAELEQVLEAKGLAAREGLFEEAALLRARELELKARLAGAPGEAATVVPVVTVAHIAAVVAAWTGVPAEALSADERAAVAGLPAALAGRVLGQDAAVEAAARAVARGAAGLRDRGRPVATLMFAGPTGVG